jgi:radical SAM protein with 4Fe4S-binding SPASM domain
MACGDCIAHQIGSADFFQTLASRGGDFPLAGSLELTLDCNLWCRHCYIRYPGATDGELSTAEAVTVLDRLADRGVLSLLLTGGEIFARPDFREIYLHAKRKGFLLTLFTNATLVDDALRDFLHEWPPRRIEITVYGHTEAAYERVTGIRGSWARCRRGIELLLARGLPVYLKMMVLRSNLAELEDVRAWAAHLGVPFRCDGVVNPRLDGHRGPLRERLDPEDVVRVQGTGPEEQAEFARLRDLARSSRHDGRLFRCGAGIRTFHVDPRGQMHPCMMWRSTPYDFLREEGTGGWESHVDRLRRLRIAEGTGCTTCDNSLACGNCGATSLLEAGTAGQSVDYYCAIGRAREKLLDVVRSERLHPQRVAAERDVAG